MTRLILWRLVQLPIILAVVFLITFWLAWMLPGNPLERPEGKRPPVEVIQAMESQYNLDNPVAFMGAYVRDAVLHLDFGPSLMYRDQRVTDVLSSGLPISATLGLVALILALHIGLFAGVIGALKPGTLLDGTSLTIALVGVSLPTFVTGSILMVLLAVIVPIFPAGGWGTPQHLILPALTLSALPAAYIARLIRLGLADVMRREALFKHAMNVAFLPVLSFLGPAAAGTLTGSFVVEKVFSVPGLGEYFINAVLNKDQYLILGLVLTFATILVVFNLFVDVAYAWVDPRIELS